MILEFDQCYSEYNPTWVLFFFTGERYLHFDADPVSLVYSANSHARVRQEKVIYQVHQPNPQYHDYMFHSLVEFRELYHRIKEDPEAWLMEQSL